MKRRQFIQTIPAIFALSACFVGPQPHILYADGVHDDTEALQAWARKEPVVWADGTPVGDHITKKKFFINPEDHLFKVGNVDGYIRDEKSTITDCIFCCSPDMYVGDGWQDVTVFRNITV